ncbi:hypothetical protein MHYP_G00225670 [Metynnis hypsauchen]
MEVIGIPESNDLVGSCPLGSTKYSEVSSWWFITKGNWIMKSSEVCGPTLCNTFSAHTVHLSDRCGQGEKMRMSDCG